MITTKQKAKVIQKVQTHKTDTGSADVQVAILSERIDRLAKHLKKNHKDKHSRRGLLGMVAERRKQLKYLKRTNFDRYTSVTGTLGLKNN